MSVKRVNFTGRRRIPRERIDVVVRPGSPRTFDAALQLDGLEFPPESAVFVEATCAGSSAVQRFPFGEAGNLRAPEPRSLDQLDGERVFFAVKVVDRSERHGRILGFAEQVRPRNAGPADSGGESILEVRTSSLGQELWRMSFETFPCLLLNENVPGLKERVRNDPFFAGAVLPSLVREVLRKVLENSADEDDPAGWRGMWRKFGKSLHPESQGPPDRDDDTAEEWIDAVVERFCKSHCLADNARRMLSGEEAKA